MNDIELSEAGLHLSTPLPDGGHVNVRTGKGTTNIHIESKCAPDAPNRGPECEGKPGHDAQYLNQVFIPWSAVGVEAGDCVEWVQFSETNFHFGENGEEPFCLEAPTPDPEPQPEVTPPVTEAVVVTDSPARPELAETGVDPLAGALVASALVLAGIALVLNRGRD